MAGSQQLQTTENETAISEYNEETLCRDLAEIPTRMRMFSLSMRSLYAENAVSSKSPVAAKLNKLRDDMKADALVYIKGLLPASTRLIECINDFFDNYVDYSYDEWLSRLPSILEDVTEYTECCKVVVTMHERVMASLKRREDEAKVTLKELKEVNNDYLKMKERLDITIPLQYVGAIALFLVDPPLFGVLAPLLATDCAITIAESTAYSRQAMINVGAAALFDEAILPSLGRFIDCLKTMAGFFSVMKYKLSSFNRQGRRSEVSREHFQRMKSKASQIVSYCTMFYQITPDVRSDFFSLPETPDEENYVDKWLENTKKAIQVEYKHDMPPAVHDLFSKFQKRMQIRD